MSIVQHTSGSNTVSVPAGFSSTPESIGKAFALNNTSGNTIIMAVGVDQHNPFSATTFTASDTQGNVYTQVFEVDMATNVGPGLAFFIAKNIAAGPNTVTAHYIANSTSLSATFTNLIVIAEVSGWGASPSIQDKATFQTHTGGTVSCPIHDSFGTAVTLGSTVGAPSNSDYALVDILLASGQNHLLACSMEQQAVTTPTITPIGYATLTEIETPTLNGWYLHFWDSAGGAAPSAAQPAVWILM